MKRRLPAPLAWLGGLLAIYLVAPFLAGIGQFGAADWRLADWHALGAATLVSVASASIATLAVAVGAIPLGYRLARDPGRRMALLGFLVQLPLALPPLASGVLLLFLLGYASPLGRVLGGAVTDSFAGIVVAEAFVAAPFLIIAARSAFAGVDPALEDVAVTLGHGRASVFLRVSLPLAWRGILAGMLLTWLRAFGEFGATVMVAYHPFSLPVYTYVAFGSEGLPAMLPVLVPTLLAAVGVMGGMLLVGRSGAVAPAVMANGAQDPVGPPYVLVDERLPRRPRPLDLAFRRALDGFSLDVAWRTGARRLAILGASGSGKSMTLRLIAGLDQPTEGHLALDGHVLSRMPPERRGIAYVPQAYGLFPHLTLERQLRFAVDGDAGQARRWTARLGLSGLEHRLPGALSLGQQQRVALARALSRKGARLLLLDEPFSALDAPLRAQLRRELRALQGEIEATTILVTHDPDEAFLLADEIMVLQAGRVLQTGTVADVYARPANREVARLLGAQNLAEGFRAGSHGIAIGDGLTLKVSGAALPGEALEWSVRPELVRVSAQGRYRGEIVAIAEPVAGRRDVTIRLGDALLRAVVEPSQGCEVGECRVAIDPAALQVWPRLASVSRPVFRSTPAEGWAEEAYGHETG